MTEQTLTCWKIHPLPLSPFRIEAPLLIGRHASCGLTLSDDDVSRNHALVEERGGALVIADQGSRNGVYIAGRRIGVAPLAASAIVRIGQTVLWFGPATPFRVRLEAFLATEARRAGALILAGEPGVGKRTIARAVHDRSGRSGPFVALAGAVDPRVLAAFAGGTLVCDAGADFAVLAAEAAQHRVRLVGLADRVPASTQTAFEVPPLRARLDELPNALGVLLHGAAYDADFLEALACHPFPLNFTELVVLCHDLAREPGPYGIERLPHAVRAHIVEARSAGADDLSRERLHDALTRHKGNVRRVGQELGVQRGQLYRVLAGFGLNPDAYRGTASASGPLSPPQPVPSTTRRGDERRTAP